LAKDGYEALKHISLIYVPAGEGKESGGGVKGIE
jgi:hypothetical protein